MFQKENKAAKNDERDTINLHYIPHVHYPHPKKMKRK